MEWTNFELPNNDYDYKQEKINKEIHDDLEFSSKALQWFKYIFMWMLVILMI